MKFRNMFKLFVISLEAKDLIWVWIMKVNGAQKSSWFYWSNICEKGSTDYSNLNATIGIPTGGKCPIEPEHFLYI